MEPVNVGLILIINVVFAFPFSSILHEMIRIFKNDAEFTKKGSIRWLIFFALTGFTMWFYLVYSSLFRWRF